MADSGDQALGLWRGTTSIREYDTRWPHEFEREAATLRSTLGELVSKIEHIGSTAVPGLASKPVLDVALAFASTAELAEVSHRASVSIACPTRARNGSSSRTPSLPTDDALLRGLEKPSMLSPGNDALNGSVWVGLSRKFCHFPLAPVRGSG